MYAKVIPNNVEKYIFGVPTDIMRTVSHQYKRPVLCGPITMRSKR